MSGVDFEGPFMVIGGHQRSNGQTLVCGHKVKWGLILDADNFEGHFKVIRGVEGSMGNLSNRQLKVGGWVRNGPT